MEKVKGKKEKKKCTHNDCFTCPYPECFVNGRVEQDQKLKRGRKRLPLEVKKQHQREYEERHKEERREYYKKYYQEHKEEYRARERAKRRSRHGENNN